MAKSKIAVVALSVLVLLAISTTTTVSEEGGTELRVELMDPDPMDETDLPGVAVSWLWNWYEGQVLRQQVDRASFGFHGDECDVEEGFEGCTFEATGIFGYATCDYENGEWSGEINIHFWNVEDECKEVQWEEEPIFENPPVETACLFQAAAKNAETPTVWGQGTGIIPCLGLESTNPPTVPPIDII